ncbi:hypothetical protein D3C76_1527760 [compost metagenome]
MEINPMAPLMSAFQTVLVYHQWPEWQGLWLVAVLAILMCIVGMGLFRRHAGEMVDEL